MNNNSKQVLTKGLVSIVVPVYNGEQFLRENIESIINQTYEQIEIIYVCDGCTDHTVEILCEYAKKDFRITVKVETENKGAAISRNIGMNMATGDWIIFFDADDLFDSHMIEEMLEMAVNKQADMAVCYLDYFDDEPHKDILIDDTMRKWHCNTYPVIETADEQYHILQIVDTVPCTKLIHKSLYTKEEVYFQNLPNANDIYYSIVAAINANRIVYIEKAFFYYRSNKGRNTLSTDRNLRKNCVLEAYNKIFEYIQHRKNNRSLLRSFYNKVINGLYVYSNYEVYNSLFDSFRNVYIKIWGMDRHDIMSQLSYINKIYFKNVIDNIKEIDKPKLHMQAKVEFIRMLSQGDCSIWGTGTLGSSLLNEISNTDIKIQHIFDSSQAKWGKEIQGYIIENPISTQAENIVVTTPKYFYEIKDQICDRAKNIYNLEQQIWMIPFEDEVVI